jgi:hypothetical protein
MKLFLLLQTENRSYDVYKSCVVVAESPSDDIMINPDGQWRNSKYRGWASSPSKVTCKYLGEADQGLEANAIVCFSFNVG